MNFGQAIEAVRQGKLIQRKLWMDSGCFVCMQIASDIPSDVVPKMQSLPEAAKEVILSRGTDAIHYRNQFIIVYPDNYIYGWVASPSDISAEDWRVL